MIGSARCDWIKLRSGRGGPEAKPGGHGSDHQEVRGGVCVKTKPWCDGGASERVCGGVVVGECSSFLSHTLCVQEMTVTSSGNNH